MPQIVQTDKLFKITKLVVVGILAVLLILLGALGIFKPIQSLVVSRSEVLFLEIREKIDGSIPNFTYLNDRRVYLSEIERLQGVISNLQTENTALININEELKTLKKQNEFETEYITKPALVISYIPDRFAHMVINKGSSDFINQGDAVVLEGYLLGTIVEIEEKTSIVRLINSNESSVASQGLKDKARGVVVGDISRGLIMQEIPGNSKLKVGEIIVTASRDSSLPGGLLVGKVQKIDETASLANKSAELEILANLDDLDKVFVLTEE